MAKSEIVHINLVGGGTPLKRRKKVKMAKRAKKGGTKNLRQTSKSTTTDRGRSNRRGR